MLQQQQVLQGRYQLQQILGHNAGRQTWLAVDVQNQTPVVVKLLTFSDRVQWDQLRLFEREAQVLKYLDHSRIPQYRDFFCLDDRLFWFALVQDYIDGSTLKQLLEQGKQFDEAEVRQLAKQLLEILTYLHGLSPPVLHRDIKPSNLILKEDHQLYLIDFGAVQDRAAKEGATFTVAGTYGYAPLEQLGGRATPASDLYALGTTLIHLLTGVAPANLYRENGRIQFTALHLNPGFVRWLWRLTEANVELRFMTAQEAVQALQNNEAAIHSAVVVKPKASRIQLKKSPQQLEIFIRGSIPAWMKGLGLVSLAYIAYIAYLAYSLMSLGKPPQYGSPHFLQYLDLKYALLTAPLSGALACMVLSVLNAVSNGSLLAIASRHSTHLRFDSRHFEISWRWLGIRKRKQGKITDIGLSQGEFDQPNSGSTPNVILTAGTDEYLISSTDPPMTEAERCWLRQEIQQWLGLE